MLTTAKEAKFLSRWEQVSAAGAIALKLLVSFLRDLREEFPSTRTGDHQFDESLANTFGVLSGNTRGRYLRYARLGRYIPEAFWGRMAKVDQDRMLGTLANLESAIAQRNVMAALMEQDGLITRAKICRAVRDGGYEIILFNGVVRRTSLLFHRLDILSKFVAKIVQEYDIEVPNEVITAIKRVDVPAAMR